MKYGMRRFGLIGLVALVIAGVMIGAAPNRIAGSAALTPTPSFIPTPIPAGTSNSVWMPAERDFDGVTMVLVPAGCFMMGSTEAQIDDAFDLAKKYDTDAKRAWFEDEMPVHEICFDQPFWIDKYEVSQAQFSQFNGQANSAPAFKGDKLPVEQITWFESKAFCEVRGARLPTEAEWEYAARGTESRVYPWGNDFDPDNAVYGGNSGNNTAPVGSRPGDVSWVGMLDMSGNVWEWVSSLYQSYPYLSDDGREADTGSKPDIRRVLRGGSWFNFEDLLRAANRDGNNPELMLANVGFRCARASAEGEAQITPTPVVSVATPIPAGTLNTVWTPVERDFDGVTMVLVPAGCFMMGSTDAQIDDAVESTRKYFPNAWRGWFDAETPVHRVCFEQAFWIDKYEVSQAQFSQMNGTAGEKPRFTGGNLPVEMITWFESESFCEARGAHLPTEAEWEYAARGPEGWLYPWGNDFVAVVYDGNSNDQTAPVGSRRDGISWVGAHDLSGNVWEWIADRYDETYYVRSPQNDPQGPDSGGTHVLRGGGSDSVESFLRAPHRTGYYPAPGSIIDNLGFRCARPAYEQLN